MHDDDEGHDFMMDEFSSGDLVEDIEGIEKFTLTSVGIDIGSSTTHTIFSRLILRREGAGLSAKFVVTNRDVLFRSPIMLTPYTSGTQIDTDSVKAFVQQSYADAGYTPDDIDTGAVVITGEALKKENAQPILEMFSEESGRFICATAGPMHEALLAAYGSGAVAMSKHHHNSVLDVDVGGGTTKISLIQGGEITQMIAVEVGARLIAYDDAMTVTRVEQPARTIMRALGHTVEVGDRITPERIEEFAQKMTDVLFDVMDGGELDPLTESLMLTEGLREHSGRDIDHLMFSGGVSEYIYDREATTFGDIGPAYGAAIRHRTEATFRPGRHDLGSGGHSRHGDWRGRVHAPGVREHLLHLDGRRAPYPRDPGRPCALIDKEQTPKQMSDALSNALGKYDVGYLNGDMALALNVTGQPDYWYIRKLAESIANIVDPAGEPAAPLFLVLDVDVAKSLGGIMREELKIDRSVICIDGIEVGDLDYIDIGKPMGVSEVIPVTVKSLIFAIRSTSG